MTRPPGPGLLEAQRGAPAEGDRVDARRVPDGLEREDEVVSKEAADDPHRPRHALGLHDRLRELAEAVPAPVARRARASPSGAPAPAPRQREERDRKKKKKIFLEGEEKEWFMDRALRREHRERREVERQVREGAPGGEVARGLGVRGEDERALVGPRHPVAKRHGDGEERIPQTQDRALRLDGEVALAGTSGGARRGPAARLRRRSPRRSRPASSGRSPSRARRGRTRASRRERGPSAACPRRARRPPWAPARPSCPTSRPRRRPFLTRRAATGAPRRGASRRRSRRPTRGRSARPRSS